MRIDLKEELFDDLKQWFLHKVAPHQQQLVSELSLEKVAGGDDRDYNEDETTTMNDLIREIINDVSTGPKEVYKFTSILNSLQSLGES